MFRAVELDPAAELGVGRVQQPTRLFVPQPHRAVRHNEGVGDGFGQPFWGPLVVFKVFGVVAAAVHVDTEAGADLFAEQIRDGAELGAVAPQAPGLGQKVRQGLTVFRSRDASIAGFFGFTDTRYTRTS